MGRPATWNEPELLTTVMRLFRRKGYCQTSLKDIEQATDLHPGSLYKAYGSKDQLFVAALHAYNERVVAERVRTHLDHAERPLRGVRAMFVSTFDGSETDIPGCLLTNTAVESTALGPEARRAVAEGFDLLRDGFARALERARARGDVPPSTRPAVLAARLLALYQGVLVLVRFGTPADHLSKIVDETIASMKGATPWTSPSGKRTRAAGRRPRPSVADS
ncbi:MAG TPA: TetR/AcrR family transcriptional regulator [Candidatus Binatia bacterium]|jgi:AcrR family transcriptional regulator